MLLVTLLAHFRYSTPLAAELQYILNPELSYRGSGSKKYRYHEADEISTLDNVYPSKTPGGSTFYLSMRIPVRAAL